MTSFDSYFSVIQDLRQQGKVLHKLIDILFIAVAGFLAGADDWDIVIMFAEERIDWFKKYLELPNGIPSVHTFRRVFRMIEPKQFEKCFILWTKDIARRSKGSVVAIDGKTVRGAKDAGQEKSPIHIVSAWSSQNHLFLGQVKTDEKSNELTAIPELLDLLLLNGSIVTLDAMGTQKDIARKIVKDKEADYVLALKKNQENLYKDVEDYFIFAREENFKDIEYQFTRTVEKGHGRIDVREYYLISDISWLESRKGWEGLRAVGKVVCRSRQKDKETEETRYFLSSITNITDFSNAVREHWGIESMHWILDVVFNEDKSRIRKENEPENAALLRKMALNILKIDTQQDKANDVRPRSYNAKRYKAAVNVNYLEKVMIDNILNS
ncbi:MAG: Transposase DDE domain protein [Firmicutes bacterium ADurb.Bin419]|nr:MAG: Transposase DDE domain protein [Firmicutes bacterium ADurb.Bin419]